MEDIRNLSYNELKDYFVESGHQEFRAAQLFDWIYKKGERDFDKMNNLSVGLRKQLKRDFELYKSKIIKSLISKDKTRKYIFSLKDKETIETVIIPSVQRATVCISTQVGCKFGCKFCASGLGGFSRNLSCAEIIEQILSAKEWCGSRTLSHIVFMGIGEPFDNYKNVMKAIRIINADKGLNIAARRITISTCGLIPQIKALSSENLQIELSISLHGYDDESRNKLIPINKKYPISKLISACREYIKDTNRQITFEYIVIKDITCSEEAGIKLGKLLKDMNCKINLIPYNQVSEFEYQSSSRREMTRFQYLLSRYGIHSTIRTPRGRDITAACGQLRLSINKEGK